MPNWTESLVRIYSKTEEELDRFISDGVPGEAGQYTFASWIPMPRIYKDYDTTNHHSSSFVIGEKRALGGEKSVVITEKLKKDWERAEQRQQNKYGAVGWYNWSIKYWGTKWDADFELDRISKTKLNICLETAWDSPNAFFLEISRRYPDFVIDLLAHDESGWNKHEIFRKGRQSNDITSYDGLVIKEILREKVEGLENKVELLRYLDEYINSQLFCILDEDPDSMWNTFLGYVEWKKEEEGLRGNQG